MISPQDFHCPQHGTGQNEFQLRFDFHRPREVFQRGAQVVIRDLGPWHQHYTVTNDAENVVAKLHEAGQLTDARRLLYFDSRGDLDEIVGVVHVKDVLGVEPSARRSVPLRELLRPVAMVPESRELGDLLVQLPRPHRRSRPLAARTAPSSGHWHLRLKASHTTCCGSAARTPEGT